MNYKLLLPDEHEDAESLEDLLQNEAPSAYVRRVTGLKLDAAIDRMIRRGLAPAPVLCSDTTVALGRVIYGKPQDDQDARRMLAELSGRAHRVLTAVAVEASQQRYQELNISQVRFEAMTESQIAAYVATGEPMGKAGAYAVQGRAAMHISKISGSYTGIMGLPLRETAALLAAVGVKI